MLHAWDERDIWEEQKIHFQLVLQREKIFKKDWFDHDKKMITLFNSSLDPSNCLMKKFLFPLGFASVTATRMEW